MLDLLHVARAHTVARCVAEIVVVRAVVRTIEAGRWVLAVVSGQLDSRNGSGYAGLAVTGNIV